MISSVRRIVGGTALVLLAACSSSTLKSATTSTSLLASTTSAVPSTTAPATTAVATTEVATTLAPTTVPPTTVPPTSTAPSTTVAPTVPPTTAPTETTPATVAPPPDTMPAPPPTESTAPPTTSATGVQPCKSAGLKMTLGPEDGAAGNQYTPIIFTNTSKVKCTLDGHPGVSFVDAAGNQVGPSAERVPGATPTVTLQPGGKAHATIDYHDPGFFDNCNPVSAPSLKVYPPDETVAITIPDPTQVCTGPIGQAQFTIDVTRAGTNLP